MATVVEIEVDDDREVESDDGILELEAPSFELFVTCTDAAGNQRTAIAKPLFTPDDDKDRDKRKRKGKSKRKHKDKDKDKDGDD